MPHTILQARIVARVSDMLVLQRRATKQHLQAIKAEFDTYAVAQMALDKSLTFAANLESWLAALQAQQTPITEAATAVGVTDFVSRWQELDTVRSTLATATTGNIGTRLTAIINGLPDETFI